MKKKVIVAVITMVAVCCIFTGYVSFRAHTTPDMAIRTYLFMSGHPFSALTTAIAQNQFQTELDRNSLELQNAKIYSLTSPSLDISGNHLFNYKVIKEGLQYYAEPYGEA